MIMKVGNGNILNIYAMHLSRDEPMIVEIFVDVLQFQIFILLPISVQLSVNYTLLITEQNGAKLECENFTYTKLT